MEDKFEQARLLFPGTKRGYDTEFKDLAKKHKDWRKVLSLLVPAIQQQIKWRVNANGEFRPPWKNFKTWLYQRCWEEEVQEKVTSTVDRLRPVPKLPDVEMATPEQIAEVKRKAGNLFKKKLPFNADRGKPFADKKQRIIEELRGKE